MPIREDQMHVRVIQDQIIDLAVQQDEARSRCDAARAAALTSEIAHLSSVCDRLRRERCG